jgi:hypothetical protein
MPNFRDCRNPKWCVVVVVDLLLLLLFVTFYSNVQCTQCRKMFNGWNRFKEERIRSTMYSIIVCLKENKRRGKKVRGCFFFLSSSNCHTCMHPARVIGRKCHLNVTSSVCLIRSSRTLTHTCSSRHTQTSN